jgi:NTP pyrophosphatase (non-canonical NTP hydrolase)
MDTFKKLQQQVLKFRDDRDWAQFHGAKDLVLGMLVEAGELAEHFQYLKDDELKEYQKEFKEDIADEMADVLFWLVLMSAELDIDLEKAFARKMKKNEAKYPLEEVKEAIGSLKSGKLFNRVKEKRKRGKK